MKLIISKKFAKKAETGTWVLWFVRVIITLLIISIIVYLLNNIIKENLDIKKARFFTIATRLLYSNDCFVYNDGIINNPGVFDFSKINQESLDKCFSKSNQQSTESLALKQEVGFKVVIRYNENNNPLEKELFFNKEFYEDAKFLTFSNKYDSYSNNYLIFLKKNELLIPAKLFIEVVWKK
ncbi:MAG: hypothetical protein QXE31_04450 [Candidatus Woesearchaeota archaeon]